MSSVRPLDSSCLGSLGSRQDRSDVGQGILCLECQWLNTAGWQGAQVQEWEEHLELLEEF